MRHTKYFPAHRPRPSSAPVHAVPVLARGETLWGWHRICAEVERRVIRAQARLDVAARFIDFVAEIDRRSPLSFVAKSDQKSFFVATVRVV